LAVKLKQPTLKFQHLRGDTMEVYKILHGVYDKNCSVQFSTYSSEYVTRSYTLNATNSRCCHDLQRYSFSCGIVNIWLRLSIHPQLTHLKTDQINVGLVKISFNCMLN